MNFMLQRLIDREHEKINRFCYLGRLVQEVAAELEALGNALRPNSAFTADAKEMRKRRNRGNHYTELILQLIIKKGDAHQRLTRYLRWQRWWNNLTNLFKETKHDQHT